jgi:aminoglycoside phosphotransferase family enzyme
MNQSPAMTDRPAQAAVGAGNASAEIRETHTGIVILIGDRAYKVKKPIATDFLDFSTTEKREHACEHEVALNSRLAPASYLGVTHLGDPKGGPAEPVIVMRRYPDTARLAFLVSLGEPVEGHLHVIAEVLARFHADAGRGQAIDADGTVDAVANRWKDNISELDRFAGTVVSAESIREVQRRATQFMSGRGALFAERIADRRIVDGHADLVADDIFCLPDGPVLLDCLEFDDHLRYVDGIDDAAFLAMDLEFLGRKDLGNFFLAEYGRLAGDSAPPALTDFYIAYRAVGQSQGRLHPSHPRSSRGRERCEATHRHRAPSPSSRLRPNHPRGRRARIRKDNPGSIISRTGSCTGHFHRRCAARVTTGGRTHRCGGSAQRWPLQCGQRQCRVRGGAAPRTAEPVSR